MTTTQGEFKFGKIIILDGDRDGRYQSKTDQMLDETGQALSPQQAKQKSSELLKFFQIQNWQGLPLQKASEYFQLWEAAQHYRQSGRWMSVHFALHRAEFLSQSTPINFPKHKSEQTLKLAMIKGIEIYYQDAERLAQSGTGIAGIEEVYTQIKDDLDFYHRHFQAKKGFDEPRRKRTLEIAYPKICSRLRQEILHAANQGDIILTEQKIDEWAKTVLEGNRDFPHLMLRMDGAYADQQLQDAYRNRIPLLWDQAGRCAMEGDVTALKKVLKEIQQTIAKGNRLFKLNLSYLAGQEKRLMEKAMAQAVERAYEKAEDLAKTRNSRGARYWLDRAKARIRDYNRKFATGPGAVAKQMTFDKNRAKKIISCIERRTQCE